ncbi:choice-of-anchor D domain-containing protein [Bacteroidota bacterium]
MKKYRLLVFIYFFFIIISSGLQAQRWEKVSTPYSNAEWLDIYFLPSNPSYGWVCGHYGEVIRTSDGGNTWNGVIIPGNYQLESIHFPSVSIGYTSGGGKIFKSTNSGASWFDITPTSSTITTQCWGCYFLDNNNGFVVGGGCDDIQRFFRTTDGGSNWSLFQDTLANSGLTDLLVYSMFGLGFASSSGWIWQTNDGGISWTPWLDTGPNDWQEEISRIGNSFLVPTSAGCTGGAGGGGIRFTTDNGSSWNRYNTGNSMFGTFLLSAQTGWAAGSNKNVWFTSNGGQDWQLRNCGFSNGDLDDIWFITSNNGWIVGNAGVYRMANPLQEADRDAINFGDICIPGSKTEVVVLDNINFNSDAVTLSISNDPNNEFSIAGPGTGFNINSCESERVQIKFEPKNTGNKTAQLRVDFAYGTTININLSGYAIRKTAAPADTVITINPAYCANQNIKGLNWTAGTDRESIASIERIEGSNLITNKTNIPIDITAGSIQTNFSANPVDTGWISARFKCDFLPCSGDTFITVAAYGVSPIITSESSMTFALKCEVVGSDTIPVFNTGNGDLVISDARIVENNTNFSILGWGKGKSLPIIIPPDSSVPVIIRYVYNEGGGNDATLRLVNNDLTTVRSDKSPFDISLSGTYLTSDMNINDTLIDFGDVCLNGEEEFQFFVINKGVAVIDSLEIIKMNPDTAITATFDKTEYPINLRQNDSIRCTVTFKPKRIGKYTDTLYIVEYLPCIDTIKVVVTGNCITASMNATPNQISATLQTLMPHKTTVYLSSTGTEDIDIFVVELGEPDNNILIDINPTLSQILPYDGMIEFEISITSLVDTVYDGHICFRGRGICKCGICVPLVFQSYSAKVEFNKDSISFGYYECNTGYYLDTLLLFNTGFIVDSIATLEILPPGSPFTILNMPALPFEMQPNDTLPLYIEFAAIEEGYHSATLTMNTSSSKSFSLTLPITGEYRTATSDLSDSPDSSAIADFGDVEQCDVQKEIYIKLYNSGTLRDSITITYPNGTQSFVFVPDDYIIVPPEDSAEFVIYMNPPDFLNTASYVSKLLFTSQVCPDVDTLDVYVNIYHHLLTVSPGTIDYGEVWADNSVIKNFKILNESGFEKDVIFMRVVPNDFDFQITNNYSFPIKFIPGDSLIVPVKFTAPSEGKYLASVQIFEEALCLDTAYVALLADVPEELYETTVKINNHTAKPGQSITMPVYMENPVPNLNHDGLDFSFSFDPWLFMPTAVIVKNNTGQLTIPFDYSAGELSGHVDASLAEILLTGTGNIMWIQGTVFLSKPISTPINIDSFEPVTNKQVTITKIPGSLQLTDVCIPMADFKLKFINNPKVSLTENPVSNGALALNISTKENDKYRIVIFSTHGSKLSDNILDIPVGNSDFIIDVSGLSSGVYYLTLYTSNGLVFHDRFIVIN